jgi:hypothetical protein
VTAIASLLGLGEKATAGEWEANDDLVATDKGPVAGTCVSALDWREDDANAAFIAAACNFIRSPEFAALVADAERYRWQYKNPNLDTAIDLARADSARSPQ